TGRAASFSPAILGYLRDTLNFGGLVVTDALIMAGASAAQPVPAATVGAVAAGCDALLYPENFPSVVAALDRAVGAELPAARAAAVVERAGRSRRALPRGPAASRAGGGPRRAARAPATRVADPRHGADPPVLARAGAHAAGGGEMAARDNAVRSL